jgi:hypothetical protein
MPITTFAGKAGSGSVSNAAPTNAPAVGKRTLVEQVSAAAAAAAAARPVQPPVMPPQPVPQQPLPPGTAGAALLQMFGSQPAAAAAGAGAMAIAPPSATPSASTASRSPFILHAPPPAAPAMTAASMGSAAAAADATPTPVSDDPEWLYDWTRPVPNLLLDNRHDRGLRIADFGADRGPPAPLLSLSDLAMMLSGDATPMGLAPNLDMNATAAASAPAPMATKPAPPVVLPPLPPLGNFGDLSQLPLLPANPLPPAAAAADPQDTGERVIRRGRRRAATRNDQAGVLSWLEKLSNHEEFYRTIKSMLANARGGDAADTQKLDDLVAAYQVRGPVKDLIDRRVRVAAQKRGGMVAGTGLDELFQTARTTDFITRSYRPPIGVESTSRYHDGTKQIDFDWMDAQRQVRLSTEAIVWAISRVGQVSSHTGTFHNEFRGKWMIARQQAMHELRHSKLIERTTPRNAVIQALYTHLAITENVAGFTQHLASYQASPAVLSNGMAVRDAPALVMQRLGINRNKIKAFLDGFTANSSESAAAPHSPAQPYDIDATDRSAGVVSPRQPDPTTPPAMAITDDNQLPALAAAAQVDWPAMNADAKALGVQTGHLPEDPNRKPRKGKGKDADGDDDM